MTRFRPSDFGIGVARSATRSPTLVEVGGDYDVLGDSEYNVSRKGYRQPPVRTHDVRVDRHKSVQFLGVLARDQAQKPFVSIPTGHGDDFPISDRSEQKNWTLNAAAHRNLKTIAGYLQSTDPQDWKRASDELEKEYYMNLNAEDSLPQILDAFLTLVIWMSERNLNQLVEVIIRLLSKDKTNLKGISHRRVIVEFVRNYLREADYHNLLLLCQ